MQSVDVARIDGSEVRSAAFFVEIPNLVFKCISLLLFVFIRDSMIDHLQNELSGCQMLIVQLKRKIISLEEQLSEKVSLRL